ncbi:uncharacterized protein SCODWIG_02146 [Saccharomycodes ludwigii]|uniref:Zinc finger H2C2-type histone UAS binding domain-containing protein n=1 Tax=Saccharomycodes ludwigii TaxID=36035 RepID=A0A376B6R8_9ASCO|nr:uncharacterized protein SCODWIG_02146 [Saccharomycodes ludwigii]
MNNTDHPMNSLKLNYDGDHINHFHQYNNEEHINSIFELQLDLDDEDDEDDDDYREEDDFDSENDDDEVEDEYDDEYGKSCAYDVEEYYKDGQIIEDINYPYPFQQNSNLFSQDQKLQQQKQEKKMNPNMEQPYQNENMNSHQEQQNVEISTEYLLPEPFSLVLKDGETAATLYPLYPAIPELLPQGLLFFLLEEFNMEIEKGDTLPFYEPLTYQEFIDYWFVNKHRKYNNNTELDINTENTGGDNNNDIANTNTVDDNNNNNNNNNITHTLSGKQLNNKRSIDFLKDDDDEFNPQDGLVCVMVLGEIPELDLTAFKHSKKRKVNNLKNSKLNSIQWEKKCLGAFYIKPAYPGRSSHICSSTFLVNAGIRGKGIGKIMVEKYLEWSTLLGFTLTIFPLVYENNVGIRRIFESLDFKRLGKLPASGVLKGFDDPVASYFYYQELNHSGIANNQETDIDAAASTNAVATNTFATKDKRDDNKLREPIRRYNKIIDSEGNIVKYLRLRHFFRTNTYPDSADRAEKANLRSSRLRYRYDEINDKLFLNGKEVIYNINEQYKHAEKLHNLNHCGINKLSKEINKHYFWPRIKDTIFKIVENCGYCKSQKKFSNKKSSNNHKDYGLTIKPTHTPIKARMEDVTGKKNFTELLTTFRSNNLTNRMNQRDTYLQAALSSLNNKISSRMDQQNISKQSNKNENFNNPKNQDPDTNNSTSQNSLKTMILDIVTNNDSDSD